MLCAAPRPSFLTANLSTVYGISIRQESTSRQHTHTYTHTSAVPEHGPTLTGPTPSLELTASHEPKENKFYQTAIAIRMNSLKDIYFWFLDFFVNVVFFFSSILGHSKQWCFFVQRNEEMLIGARNPQNFRWLTATTAPWRWYRGTKPCPF